MMRFRSTLGILMSLLSLSIAPTFAEDKTPVEGESCNNKLQHVGPFHIVHSAQTGREVREYLEKAAKERFGVNGALDLLGISRPAHILEFVPSNQLAMLATLGRFPVANWLDGAIISDFAGSAGVLEFVWEGCPACRSYFRDTTPLIKQVGVMDHVAGHNDFSVNSWQQRIRHSDPMAASKELGDIYEVASQGPGREAVSLYYQWLFSISDLQDYWKGTYQSVDDLKEIIAQNDGKVPPTESVVQLMVAAQSKDAPLHERELLRAYEKTVRGVAAVPPTKIMNEGWATFLQFLIPPYTTFTKTEAWVELGELLYMVKPYFDPSNPYWLGFEAWFHFYQRFMREPTIQALPNKLERDRAFVKKAHHMMGYMNDVSFLREALDENWVKKNNLVLARVAKWDEQDQSLPHPGNPEYNAQFIVTENGRAVIDEIANKFADKRRIKPSILGYDVRAGGTQAFAIEHEVFENMPLQLTMAAQNLYVMAQIVKRPVSLKTIRVNFEKPKQDFFNPWGRRFPGEDNEFSGYVTEKIRIEVDMNGKTRVYLREGEAGKENEVEHAELTKYLQAGVDAYRNDVSVDLDDESYAMIMQRHANFVSEATDHQLAHGMRMLSHNPRAADALSEFAEFMAKRLKRATKALVEGRLPVTISGNNISFQAMPTLPRFVYDKVAVSRMKKIDKQKGDADRGLFLASFSQNFVGAQKTPPTDLDRAKHLKLGFFDALSNPMMKRANEQGIYRSPRQKGDKFWGPDPEDGQGEGEGKADQGAEDGEDPAKGKKPGQGGSSGVVTLPKEIFGQILAEELELPNLRPKNGLNNSEDPVFDGGVRKETGELLIHRMVGDAYALGLEKLKEQGIEHPDLQEAVLEGFKYLGPQHYVVRDRDEEPNPEINAVVVYDRDMSGSMWGDREKRAREYVFYVSAFLKAKYPRVKEHFIGFSGYAQEFSEEDFFTQSIGGGTEYAKGIQLSEKVLEKYEASKWDKFLFPIGDLEDIAPEDTFAAFERIAPMLQYTAVVHTNIPERESGSDQAPYIALEKKSPFFGFAQVTEDFSSVMKAMRHLFKKKK